MPFRRSNFRANFVRASKDFRRQHDWILAHPRLGMLAEFSGILLDVRVGNRIHSHPLAIDRDVHRIRLCRRNVEVSQSGL